RQRARMSEKECEKTSSGETIARCRSPSKSKARETGAQPWRALNRGLVLLMMKTRPFRRTRRLARWRLRSERSELRIFMVPDRKAGNGRPRGRKFGRNLLSGQVPVKQRAGQKA